MSEVEERISGKEYGNAQHRGRWATSWLCDEDEVAGKWRWQANRGDSYCAAGLVDTVEQADPICRAWVEREELPQEVRNAK